MDGQNRVDQIFAGRDACMRALGLIFGRKPETAGAAIKIYLKNFANFNEIFGFQQGETMLRQVADFLFSLPGAQVFRLGGGVTFILLLEGADQVRATHTAQSIVERFERPWPVGQIEYSCAVDVAIVHYPDYAETPETLLLNLDLALRESAAAGQNQITVFGPALQERLYRNSIIAKLLGSAVAGNNIEIRYRPTFCAKKQRFTRIEAQVRLLTLEFGPIKAADFEPIAEASGIICFFNRHVLDKICALIRVFLDEGQEFESIAVNISPVMFIQQSFVSEVAALLEQYRIPKKKLALDIRPSPMIAPCARAVMERLSALGVEIVFTSFDRDYAGFRDILTLPLDFIKMGRPLVWQMETNPRSGPIIESIISMAGNLGINVIAEGVETEQQHIALNRYNCPYRQGFYYSQSVELSEMRRLLKMP